MAMLDYDFMVNAFLAAAIVAVVAGLVGFFLVLRGQTFAGHALSHVGFTGATGGLNAEQHITNFTYTIPAQSTYANAVIVPAGASPTIAVA